LLPTLQRSYVVVEGVGTGDLRLGPGHYPATRLPGQHGTVAVAGHRTTYLAPFRSIDRLRPWQPVVLEMPFGRFTYSVERTRSGVFVGPVESTSGSTRLISPAPHTTTTASEKARNDHSSPRRARGSEPMATRARRYREDPVEFEDRARG
jgi:hypothetical protein